RHPLLLSANVRSFERRLDRAGVRALFLGRRDARARLSERRHERPQRRRVAARERPGHAIGACSARDGGVDGLEIPRRVRGPPGLGARVRLGLGRNENVAEELHEALLPCGALVLTPDVRFEGWTVEDWQRFLDLWKPRASPEREPTRPRGGVIVIHDGEVVRKMLHTVRGRVDPPLQWPAPLEMIADEHQASWALASHVDALSEVMERFGSRARRTDDIADQALCITTIVREMMTEGSIESWPRRLRGLPVPAPSVIRRALDAT